VLWPSTTASAQTRHSNSARSRRRRAFSQRSPSSSNPMLLTIQSDCWLARGPVGLVTSYESCALCPRVRRKIKWSPGSIVVCLCKCNTISVIHRPNEPANFKLPDTVETAALSPSLRLARRRIGPAIGQPGTFPALYRELSLSLSPPCYCPLLV